MRKSILGTLLGSAFMLGSANAGLILDLNGGAAGGVITADALDWAPTSFLAQNAISAISNFQAGSCGGTSCQFDVLTQAKLTGYSPTGSGGTFVGLPAAGGEITIVVRYTERVIDASPGFARFSSTGAGFVEFYYSSAEDSSPLTGFGFNNGTLIGRLSGVTANSQGLFLVTGGPVLLDSSPDGDQYGGQQTVTGTGSQSNLAAGLSSTVLDPSFFLTSLAGFSLQYENISIGLPFLSTNPADCFNDTASPAAVGTTGLSSTCNSAHVLGTYAAQPGADPGYQPNIIGVNGLAGGGTDFIAQTDFNSAVTGAIPEPGSLALVGMALGALGLGVRRRRA